MSFVIFVADVYSWIMKHIAISTAVLLLGVSLVAAQSDEAKRVAEATTVIEEMMAAGDKAIPQSILEKAEAIAVLGSSALLENLSFRRHVESLLK